MAVMLLLFYLRGIHQRRDSHLVSHTPQHFALHELGTGVRQETLSARGETLVDNIRHNGIQHGITQKLQALILHVSERLAIE
jgi:hypothetical protein